MLDEKAPTRRSFLLGVASLLAAPSIVRASILMAVSSAAAPEAGLPSYRWVEIEDYRPGLEPKEPFGIEALYNPRWPVHVGDIDRNGVAHWRVSDDGMSGL